MTRRYLDEGRPAFVMLPHYWAAEVDEHCYRLAGLLADQREARVKGRNKLASLLGWGRRTTDEHLGHLEAADPPIVTITTHGRGRSETISLVNPALAEPRHRTHRGPLPDSQPSTVEIDTGLTAVHRSNSVVSKNSLGSEDSDSEVHPRGCALGAAIETTTDYNPRKST